MSQTHPRKGELGQPGNKGQFGARSNSSPAVSLSFPSADVADVPVPMLPPERKRWVPDAHSMLPQAQILRQTGTYESFVPARITDWSPKIPNELATDVEEATIALREFDAHAAQRLGASITELGPMSAILLRTESAHSSQIEQLTTSARQLALEELDESGKKNSNLVMRNVRAMEAAVALSEDLSVDTILGMHRKLLEDDHLLSEEAGRFRQELVWVGGEDAGPIGAALVAPQSERVPEAVSDVVAFMNRRNIPTLTKLAIAHAQFENIHPFVDGNGRTGRAIAHSLLRKDGLTTAVTVPLSAGLLRNTERYFDALTAYRNGDAAPIIRSVTNAARFASVSGTELVDNLAAQLDESRSKLAGVRSSSKAWTILPGLIGQPVINAKYVRKKFGFNEMTTQRALATLTKRGVLRERTGHSRNRVWGHEGILNVLDAYAAGIKRVKPGK